MDRFCPKCGKDYSHDAHWTVALRRHLARKKPCDAVPRTPPVLTTLETMVWPGAPRDPMVTMPLDIAKWFFSKMCARGNVCFTRPNINKDEIYLRTRDGPKITTMKEFITLWINLVIIRCFPCDLYPDFIGWLDYDTCSSLSSGYKCDGVYPPDSDFVRCMSRYMKQFMDAYPDRRHLKTMIVSFSN